MGWVMEGRVHRQCHLLELFELETPASHVCHQCGQAAVVETTAPQSETRNLLFTFHQHNIISETFKDILLSLLRLRI